MGDKNELFQTTQATSDILRRNKIEITCDLDMINFQKTLESESGKESGSDSENESKSDSSSSGSNSGSGSGSERYEQENLAHLPENCEI